MTADTTAETVIAAALAALTLARAGRFAKIRELFAPNLRSLVSADVVRAAWDAELGRNGPIRAVGAAVAGPAEAGAIAVRIPVTCARGKFVVQASVFESGALQGLFFVPAAPPAEPWAAPEYVDRGAFAEEEVSVGSGPLAVPGTLSLPDRPGRLPAVVLLAGSGPLDRDSTIGANKPLKDLAWGLASLGVAVLRFDKVTFAHRKEAAANGGFTLDDEYVHHATAAVRLLRQHDGIDAGRVFVLGHSLGGTAAPRVAAAELGLAGIVLLAGSAQPLHWAVVRQLRYIAALDPATESAAEPGISAMAARARAVDSPDLSPSTPAAELPFGIAAPYWLDLRDYDPVATAAALGRPMLILQGTRDYQVTVTDDLALWERGLAGVGDVAIRTYDADNHLFFPGSGPSGPAEYGPPQHLDPQVVADVADWIAQR